MQKTLKTFKIWILNSQSFCSLLSKYVLVYIWLVAVTILFPTAFAMLATSETNVAIPHIAGYFGATLDEANWVITSYMVANAILLPLTAWFENLMGRICAFAPSLNMMVLGRVIQGLEAGL